MIQEKYHIVIRAEAKISGDDLTDVMKRAADALQEIEDAVQAHGEGKSWIEESEGDVWEGTGTS